MIAKNNCVDVINWPNHLRMIKVIKLQSISLIQNKTITIHVFCKKSTHLWGIFNNYKKIGVPGVHIASLIYDLILCEKDIHYIWFI